MAKVEFKVGAVDKLKVKPLQFNKCWNNPSKNTLDGVPTKNISTKNHILKFITNLSDININDVNSIKVYLDIDSVACDLNVDGSIIKNYFPTNTPLKKILSTAITLDLSRDFYIDIPDYWINEVMEPIRYASNTTIPEYDQPKIVISIEIGNRYTNVYTKTKLNVEPICTYSSPA